jgi:hypothetical protein
MHIPVSHYFALSQLRSLRCAKVLWQLANKNAGAPCGFCISATITAFVVQVNMPIVRVALDIPLPTLFDYTVAEGIAVAIGQRVIVPFGRRQLVGVVMECVAATEMAPERIGR